ncbi:MAG: hypothetical protein ACPL3C_12030 [Pyrobaculum sp.]
MAPKSKTRINGACGSDGCVYRIQKRSGFLNLTKPHILIGLAIINYTAMNRIKIVLLVAMLAATALLKSQSLSITGCDTTMKYYTSEKFYGLRYGTQYDNWAKVEVTLCPSTKTIDWNGQTVYVWPQVIVVTSHPDSYRNWGVTTGGVNDQVGPTQRVYWWCSAQSFGNVGGPAINPTNYDYQYGLPTQISLDVGIDIKGFRLGLTWTETVKSTQFRLLDADICKINWVGAVNNPGWNEDAKSTWIWGYGFLGLVKPSDLQFANPGGIADGYAYFWKPIYCGFFICGYDWDYAYYKLRYNYYS